MNNAGAPGRQAPKQLRTFSAQHLRKHLYWLTQDWIHLSRALPVPQGGGGERTSNTRAYGHPAEWASDQCRQIAALFWSWHDLEAERRSEARPTPMLDRAGRRVRSERQVIVAAWKYLDPRLDGMLTAAVPFEELRPPFIWEPVVEDEAFQEIFDLHRQIRSRIGHTMPTYTLPIPCPNSECGLRTLQRRPGMKGQDYIVCGACGYTVKDSHYPFLIKVMLDTLPSQG